MRVVLVGGITNKHFKDLFKKHQDIVFTNTFTTINDLTSAIYNTGITFLNNVDSIVIIDYAFQENDTYKRIELFVELQDVLSASGLRGTKLYLITRNTDMYTGLRQNHGGIPGILYINTEVMLLQSEYHIKVMSDIIRGARDRMGLYHPDADKETLHSRLEADRDKFIEESRAVDRDILTYGTDEPISVLSNSDFADSRYTEKQVMERKREQEREERERRNQRKPKKEAPTPTPHQQQDYIDSSSKPPVYEEATPELTTVINNYGIEELNRKIDTEEHLISQSDGGKGEGLSTDGSRLKSIAHIKRLKNDVEGLRRTGVVVTDKVFNDTGVIGVYGDKQSGVSGIVANLAEVYGTANRRVLIIDLDTLNRQQSAYFPKYESHAQGFQGMKNGLMKATQGASVVKSAVDITSRVSLLAMSRSESFNQADTNQLLTNLHTLISNARIEYDIVILDIPYDHTFSMLKSMNNVVDSYILVTSDLFYQNDIYFDHVLGSYIKQDIDLMEDVFKKSRIIVNKIHKNHVLANGQSHTNSDFSKWLISKQFPYDRLYMLGEFPYYNDWESQYKTNIRYVWNNATLMYMYADILNNLILR